MRRRQVRPIQRQADRTVSIDDRTYRVTVQPRFAPTRKLNPITAPQDFDPVRTFLWEIPARILRLFVDRDGWTVTVFEQRRGWRHVRRERLVRRERAQGLTRAADRADTFVEEIEDRRLL